MLDEDAEKTLADPAKQARIEAGKLIDGSLILGVSCEASTDGFWLDEEDAGALRDTLNRLFPT